ncbi:hypothetical protein B0H10DRAFT_2095594 [Mycena sp. CBHHK59/15]|nr:hypothetical protein B0H10DRAFT_2095594 [Mycena sp. CBHHK59/15]
MAPMPVARRYPGPELELYILAGTALAIRDAMYPSLLLLSAVLGLAQLIHGVNSEIVLDKMDLYLNQAESSFQRYQYPLSDEYSEHPEYHKLRIKQPTLCYPSVQQYSDTSTSERTGTSSSGSSNPAPRPPPTRSCSFNGAPGGSPMLALLFELGP